MQVRTCFRARDANLKIKTRPVTQILTPSYNLDLKSLVPCKDKSLKKLKSSRLQMFFKIGSIEHFLILTEKHLCWGLFLIKLLQV